MADQRCRVQPQCERAVLEVLGGLGLATCKFNKLLTKEGGVLRTEEYCSTEDLRALMDKHGNWVVASNDDAEE